MQQLIADGQGAGPVALHVENAQDLLAQCDRHGQLAVGVRQMRVGSPVLVLQDVGCQNGVAGGGGGPPVYQHPTLGLEGIDAVVDKDRLAADLASELDADVLMILTDVDAVYVDYGKPTARVLDRMTLAETERLIEAGHTLLVIEHNLDVIRAADWVIDLGPEGGPRGGALVVAGRPETIAAEPRSWTGRALAGADQSRPRE